MKSTVENLSPTRVRLAVEMAFEDLKPSLDAAYKKIAQQVRVPGFRPGKVPARIIDQRVGRAAVLEEAVNSALPGAYSEAVREAELRPVGQPEIDVTNLTDGESLSFTAEVDVRPEITLPELDGLAVTVDDATVGDEDVREQVEALRERFGTLKGVDRAIADGDYVSIDLLASVDGQEVEAGSANGMSYRVGSADLVDGLDDALLGKAAGDTASFSTTLRQGEHADEQAEIRVVINSVKEQELPELDDEFAQLASEFDTMAELEADLRTRLGRAKVFEQGTQARDKLLEQLVETVQFPLPDAAVEGEVDAREHEIVHSFGHDDAMFERFLSLQDKTPEQFRDELRESARKSVRAQFLLDAVADKQEVQVGDAELTAYLIRQAARYNLAPQQFADEIVKAGNLPALVADVRRNKALAALLESTTITDASGNTVDLSQLNAEAMAEVVAGEEDDDVVGLDDTDGTVGTDGTDGE
ncbi:MAG: trigger factor [Jatrophihabitans sp.]|nr:MAG: trigger factor [Jatrophihabitans sp.]